MSTPDGAPPVTLRFVAGTIELVGLSPPAPIPDACTWDERSACFRAPAVAYADIVMALRRAAVGYDDKARIYEDLPLVPQIERSARPYQTEALRAWQAQRFRGVVVLPTGAGKTHVAHMAMADRKRSTLIIAPTLDLVRQWHLGLEATFGCAVGVVGGGEYRVLPITVTTYDSASLHMERLGAKFGLVVFDECHHLPGPSYALAARMSLAPFRLGLTATPERADGRESAFQALIGPIAYRKDIIELAGDYLSDYDTVTVRVALSPEEQAEYQAERDIYRTFIQDQGIAMGSPSGWTDFIIRSSRNAEGRRAMRAYRRQREIAFTAPAKMATVERLLAQHAHDRSILFTQDNATVYKLGRTFLIPVITHLTKVSERSRILKGLAEGRFGAVATSKVLNEGVDIPDANIAIVMSGSGSVREHVQRLGRVLRKKPGKSAILYELVTEGTSETRTSERRRDHSAYR